MWYQQGILLLELKFEVNELITLQLSDADGAVQLTPLLQVRAPGPVNTVISVGQLAITGFVWSNTRTVC